MYSQWLRVFSLHFFQNTLCPKYQTGQDEHQLQNFDCALGMILWVDTFTALESAPTATARYAASANPWTEII